MIEELLIGNGLKVSGRGVFRHLTGGDEEYHEKP
jgi:hypothetical protein